MLLEREEKEKTHRQIKFTIYRRINYRKQPWTPYILSCTRDTQSKLGHGGDN